MSADTNTETKSGSRRVTLASVARRAGVSVPSASLVLSGKAKTLSAAVIGRVNEAARELDYSPNLLVRNMQSGKTNILTFFNCFRYVPALTDLYFQVTMSAMNRAAGDMGYNILTVCNFPESDDEIYHSLNGGHSDGVILYAPEPGDPLLARFRSARLPAIMVNMADPEGVLPSVRDNVDEGMRLVAEHLRRFGHRRIAMLGGGQDNRNAPLRLALLSRYASELGMDLPADRVIPVAWSDIEIGKAIKHLIELPQPPTAIFCWSDLTASLAMRHCERLGINVPGDVSIVGYDGIVWPEHNLRKLATVAVNLEEIARRSLVNLDQFVSQGIRTPIAEQVSVAFVEGETLAAARKS